MLSASQLEVMQCFDLRMDDGNRSTVNKKEQFFPLSNIRCNFMHLMLLAFELEQRFYFSHRDKQQKIGFQPTQTKPLFESWLFLALKDAPSFAFCVPSGPGGAVYLLSGTRAPNG